MNLQITEYHPDAETIAALGGPAELARKLGYEMPKGVQRVQNWKYRGIPEIEVLRNPDIFGPFAQPAPAPIKEARDAA